MSNFYKYWYIRAWGCMLSSDMFYILGQVEQAQEENAPLSAIYRKDGGWVTFDEIGRLSTRIQIQKYVDKLKAGKSIP